MHVLFPTQSVRRDGIFHRRTWHASIIHQEKWAASEHGRASKPESAIMGGVPTDNTAPCAQCIPCVHFRKKEECQIPFEVGVNKMPV